MHSQRPRWRARTCLNLSLVLLSVNDIKKLLSFNEGGVRPFFAWILKQKLICLSLSSDAAGCSLFYLILIFWCLLSLDVHHWYVCVLGAPCPWADAVELVSVHEELVANRCVLMRFLCVLVCVFWITGLEAAIFMRQLRSHWRAPSFASARQSCSQLCHPDENASVLCTCPGRLKINRKGQNSRKVLTGPDSSNVCAKIFPLFKK